MDLLSTILITLVVSVLIGIVGGYIVAFFGVAVIFWFSKLCGKLLGANHPFVQWLGRHGKNYLLVGWAVVVVISFGIFVTWYAISVENDIQKGRDRPKREMQEFIEQSEKEYEQWEREHEQRKRERGF